MTICTMKESKILDNFGKRVRNLREAAGYSQEDFAVESGLDRSYFGAVERGQRNLSLRNVEKIAEALGITIAELMEGV